jgi:protein-L-isoaspartate(D-aspartate) O-methyltransferase
MPPGPGAEPDAWPRVMRAMRRVPRERFIPPEWRDQAWDDVALPIGCGQTISQPSLVAFIVAQLELRSGERVLEVGGGSGYLAAVLAALEEVEVYAIELIPALAQRAAQLLPALGFEAVHLRQGDGRLGWPEAAPFDAIVVSAAAPRVPPALLEQLAEGGRLIAPLGPPGGQVLTKFVKTNGGLRQIELVAVAFVPLAAPEAEPPSAGSRTQT